MEQQSRDLRWMRLDNAALIFPASLRRHWSNAYRISFNFTDQVDPALLQQALDAVAPRFPSVVVRLRRSASAGTGLHVPGRRELGQRQRIL